MPGSLRRHGIVPTIEGLDDRIKDLERRTGARAVNLRRDAPTPVDLSAIELQRVAAMSVTEGTAGGGWQAISFDTVIEDDASVYNPGTPSRAPVSVTGRYLITAFAMWDNADVTGVVRGLRVRRNGADTLLADQTAPLQSNGTTTFFTLHTVSGGKSLVAGDYLEVELYQETNPDATINVHVGAGNRPYLSAILLG